VKIQQPGMEILRVEDRHLVAEVVDMRWYNLCHIDSNVTLSVRVKG
jgi:hypothetical protein